MTDKEYLKNVGIISDVVYRNATPKLRKIMEQSHKINKNKYQCRAEYRHGVRWWIMSLIC